MPDEEPWWNDKDKMSGLMATVTMLGLFGLVLLIAVLGILKLFGVI